MAVSTWSTLQVSARSGGGQVLGRHLLLIVVGVGIALFSIVVIPHTVSLFGITQCCWHPQSTLQERLIDMGQMLVVPCQFWVIVSLQGWVWGGR
jgi:hypothetical protein